MDQQTAQLKRAIKQLQALRQSLGWSQEQCAHHLGVAYASLNRWERGASLPRSRVIIHAIDQFLAQHGSKPTGRTHSWN